MIINSVIVGAGGGPAVVPVDVKASLATQSATVNDKVTLIPSNTIYAAETFSATFSTNNQYTPDHSENVMLGGYLDCNGLQIMFTRENASNLSNPVFWTSYATFNSSVSDISTIGAFVNPYDAYTSPASIENSIDGIRPSYGWTYYNAASSHYYTNSFGLFEGSSYVLRVFIGNSSGTYTTNPPNVKGVFTGANNYWWVVDDNPRQMYKSGVTRLYPTVFNNKVYAVGGSNTSIMDTSDGSYLAGYTFSSPSSNQRMYGIKVLDANGDYYLEKNPTSAYMRMFRLDKSTTTWYEEDLSQATQVLSTCFLGTDKISSNYKNSYACQSRDFGDYIEIFLASSIFGYQGTSRGNKVAHLRFTKATKTMERFADVFYDVDDIVGSCSLSINWEQGLIAVVGIKDSSTNKVYVRKLDNTAEVYPYVALSKDRVNYTEDAIVGFVVENKGADEMGSTVLSVNTTEDPTKEPFSNLNKVIGMNVIVIGGAPQ